MSQHDYDITTADANTGITYRAAVNAALQAQASNNSGPVAPTTTYAGQFWLDTSVSSPVLRLRNQANTAWITLFSFSATQWIFVNDIIINGATFGLGGGGINTNFAAGVGTLDANVSGNYNCAIGNNAMTSSTSASNCVAIGFQSQQNNLSGGGNVSVGSKTLESNTLGSNNTIVGHGACESMLTTGNTAIGFFAMQFHNTGSLNVAIGQYAGYKYGAGGGNNLTSSSYSLFIGCAARPLNDGGTNEIVIGSDPAGATVGAGSNTTTIGTSATVKTILKGEVNAPALSTGLVTNTTATLTVDVNTTSIIANYAGLMTITLPVASSCPGRIIIVKTVQNQQVWSASVNIYPQNGVGPTNGILTAVAGKFAMLQSSGSFWQVMMSN